jgi:ABC-type lipoprotein export system ATPase subunit
MKMYGWKAMKGLLGLEEAALRVIPIGIDTEDYYPRDTAEKQNGRDLIIGYLSRLSQPFGLDLLAAAWVRLKPKFPSLKLHITGGRTGSDRAFNHRVHRILQPYLRKGEIKIFPHFDLTNRVRFLSKLDILSVPLRRPEAFGTYLLEAMAMGVPVVQPSMGAMMEIVGRTGGGLLYNPGSPRALESALEALLQDPKLRGRLGSAGADAVRKEWNIENVTKQILQVYTRICGQYERKDRKKGKNMLLTVRKIHKSYFSAEGLVLARVLNGIDLTLSEGQTMAIVGPSGSGKSTLLNIIGTLDKPDSGDLLFQGRRLNDLNEQEGSRFRNRSIGFVFQRHHLLPRFSLLDNVLLPAIAYPDGTNYEERAHFLLQKMGLERRAGFSVARLSGGERQRVAVARALLMKPRLLLADEPTGALDYENAALVFDLLLHLVEEEGLTLLAVTHSDELADRLNNKFVLRDGVLIGDT